MSTSLRNSRELFITAKSHDVSEILDPTFTTGPSPEEKELFEAKQVFMYKVFNETLLTDMGRTKVRKYLKTTESTRQHPPKELQRRES